MGKYDTIDKEFVREPEHAAEIISNVVYKGRLEVRPQDLVELHEKCKSNRNREAELERDALFLCPKHAVKYGIEVENYADYGMPRRILGYDAGEYEKEANEIWKEHEKKNDLKVFVERKSRMKETEGYYGIINVVVYLGAGHYKGKRSLKECLKNPPDRIKPLIYEQIEDYQFKLFEVEKENPENYHTELRQFIEAMQARYDKKKLSSLFKREEFQNLSTLTQKALAVHLDNNQISRKVIEEGENMCKALRDLEKDWKREGEQKQLLYLLCKKARKGKSLNVMAEELEMEQEELEVMYNVVMKFSPNYDVERVCEYLGDRILI